MKPRTLSIAILLGLLAATVWGQTPVGTNEPTYENTTKIPLAITTPDRVDTPIGTLEFFDGVPIGDTTQKVYDYVDRARAVEVFINLIPAVSVYHLRQGMRDMGLTGSNQIVIAEQMGDSKPLVLTWNNTSLYTWGFLDLAKDGPTVVEVPPGVLGVFNDMYFRYIADIGAAGQDKGQGGKYLVLPPGYEGEVPDGYFVVQSKTYGVWNFMRGYVKKGAQEATDRIKGNLKVYSLAQKNNPPEMEFINMSGLAEYKTIPPNDLSFYESLNNLVQEEPIGWMDPETAGLVASIGIVKGQPFQPDGRMRRILTEAVAIGNAYARANTVFPRDPGGRIYGPESEWVMGFADKDTYFLKDGARRFDSRLWMHYNAVVVTPAMALTRPGAGSDYGIAGLDSEHRPLYGSKTYRLHLPPNFPVKDNWSVTIYDTQTRSMLQTDQKFAGINSLGKGQKQNADGSVDVIFAPKLPKGVDKRNWIQTIPGKSWFIIFRAYGPLEPWLDKTWRPGELELVG